MLKVDSITVERSGIAIVRDISFEMRPHQVCALLGINGAGKSTLLESLSGILPVASGDVILDGSRINSWSMTRRAVAGIAHVEEGRSVFADMTTEENLRVAVPARSDIEAAFRLFPELEKRRDVRSGLLSGGEQQMLVLARAYLRNPSVFLFDELSLGLAPTVFLRLLSTVRDLADEGRSVLLVEQFATLALEIADYALVMSAGELVYSDDAAKLRGQDELLQRLYFSGSADGVTIS